MAIVFPDKGATWRTNVTVSISSTNTPLVSAICQTPPSKLYSVVKESDASKSLNVGRWS